MQILNVQIISTKAIDLNIKTCTVCTYLNGSIQSIFENQDFLNKSQTAENERG